MILAVSGLLLSSSFVMLFFLLKERGSKPRVSVVGWLFAAIVALIVAIVFSLLAALLTTPNALTTRLDFIDVQSRVCLREYRRVKSSALFLLVAIGLFTGAIIAFAAVLFV
jgi:hypothetical protein